MPLVYVQGDLLAAPQYVIAHPCNCQGAMGRGIALAVRTRYPQCYERYRVFCRKEQFRPGMAWLYQAPDGHLIANLATQEFWGAGQRQARTEWIEHSMRALMKRLVTMGIHEFACPKMGCGLGGLTWDEVRPVYERLCQEFPEFTVYVYDLRGES